MIKFIAKLKYLIHVKISYISNNKLIKIIHRNVLYIPISTPPPFLNLSYINKTMKPADSMKNE